MSTLTKSDIINSLRNEFGADVTKSACKTIVELIFSEMSDTLAHGEEVRISGFGSFSPRDKNERNGRNPKTGEAYPIEARRIVRFKASDVLKNRIASETKE